MQELLKQLSIQPKNSPEAQHGHSAEPPEAPQEEDWHSAGTPEASDEEDWHSAHTPETIALNVATQIMHGLIIQHEAFKNVTIDFISSPKAALDKQGVAETTEPKTTADPPPAAQKPVASVYRQLVAISRSAIKELRRLKPLLETTPAEPQATGPFSTEIQKALQSAHKSIRQLIKEGAANNQSIRTNRIRALCKDRINASFCPEKQSWSADMASYRCMESFFNSAGMF